MKRFSSEWWAGAVRWATIGVVAGAATLSGCRYVELAGPGVAVDTVRTCTLGSIVVTPNVVTLNAALAVQLAATSSCAGIRPSVFIYTSSAPSVAVVDRHSGLVTAVAPGTAIIVVTDSLDPGVSGTSAITVAGVPQRSIEILQNSLPARLDSLYGTVTVSVPVNAGMAGVSRADLVIASTDTVVLHGPDIGAAPVSPYLIRWHTDSVSAGTRVFPNSAYLLSVRILLTNGTSYGLQPPNISVRVWNSQ